MFGRKKKLKRIPGDLVSYITIETEAIKTYSDKQMISGYCISYMEKVDWYIQLLDTGNEKYEVPHTREHLENVRNALQNCHNAIMKVKIKEPGDNQEFKYPKGYEG